MAWISPMTAVANTAFTAAQFNTHIRDNLLETAPAKATGAGGFIVASGVNSVARRNPASNTVATQETTTEANYSALATAGPAVTVTTGTYALVVITAGVFNQSAGAASLVSLQISGATTLSASDANSLQVETAGASDVVQTSRILHFTTLTAGSNTFTLLYKAGAGTAGFRNRTITVIPLS